LIALRVGVIAQQATALADDAQDRAWPVAIAQYHSGYRSYVIWVYFFALPM